MLCYIAFWIALHYANYIDFIISYDIVLQYVMLSGSMLNISRYIIFFYSIAMCILLLCSAKSHHTFFISYANAVDSLFRVRSVIRD